MDKTQVEKIMLPNKYQNQRTIQYLDGTTKLLLVILSSLSLNACMLFNPEPSEPEFPRFHQVEKTAPDLSSLEELSIESRLSFS